MEDFPNLYSKRLKLRKMQAEDFSALVQYANNRKISDRIINIPFPYQELDAVFRLNYVTKNFNHKTAYIFAISQIATDEFIGEISLHMDKVPRKAQLGYWLGEPFWNKGIITEAIGVILKFGFEELELEEVFASCHIDNEASIKVLLKNGMTKRQEIGRVIPCTLTKEVYQAQKLEE